MSAATDPIHLPHPSTDILANASLFLDFDGTLVDIADRPDGVVVDPDIPYLLWLLYERHDGRIALVSGRSLAQLDALLGPVASMILISASHGSEHRWDGFHAVPERPSSLDIVAEAFTNTAASYPGAFVEDKSFGVALHYRLAPALDELALLIAGGLAESLGLTLQHGKMVVEVRIPGGDKGAAIRRLMQRSSMQGTHPIFLGDDLTDEPGFAAAFELGGTGILVGDGRQSTSARYALPDPASVRSWLALEDVEQASSL